MCRPVGRADDEDAGVRGDEGGLYAGEPGGEGLSGCHGVVIIVSNCCRLIGVPIRGNENPFVVARACSVC